MKIGSGLADAATARAAAASTPLGAALTQLVTDRFQLRCTNPRQVARDRRIAMHAGAVFDAGIVKAHPGQYILLTRYAARHRKAGTYDERIRHGVVTRASCARTRDRGVHRKARDAF